MDIRELYNIFLQSNGITTDTRKIKKGAMFFALKGETFDGNDFAFKALELGAMVSVCNRDDMCGTGIINVEDVLKSLQDLASYHRKEMGTTIFAVTGSNGKTTTKELIASVLSKKYRVLATTGNLNNHIGVPLTLLQLDKETNIGVVEMGASAHGEIELLCNIAQPNAGLITNIAKAHIKGFGSVDGVKKAKGELYDFLFKHGGTVLYNSSNQILCDMVETKVGLNTIPYHTKETDIKTIASTADSPYLKVVVSGVEISTKMIGSYNIDNILAALSVASLYEVPFNEAVSAIEEYNPTNNRSQLMEGRRNRLIVDAYNANPTSMMLSIRNFTELNISSGILILGDMLELGDVSCHEHQNIIKLISEMRLDRVFLVGEEFRKGAEALAFHKDNFEFYPDTIQLISRLEKSRLDQKTILIKGSRGIGLEAVIPLLLG